MLKIRFPLLRACRCTLVKSTGFWPLQFALSLFFISISSYGQVREARPFQPGEKITYKISYNWGVLWVSAGEVSFTVSADSAYGKEALVFTGKGHTYKKYDWIYRVRDLYQSTVNPENLRPYKFIRNVEEGKTTINNAYVFDRQKQLAYSIIRGDGHHFERDTLSITPETYDVITMIYIARCMDFDQYLEGEKIPIQLILDNQIYDTYIRYLGKETYHDRGVKPVLCHKFKPRLIDGTIFKGGEKMTVWVTADENKIPVFIETPILVGDIKATLNEATGLVKGIDYLEEE